MPSPLVHCIYASAASRALDAQDLAQLLDVARRNNQRLGLSGMLLYAQGSFFQVLEGPEAAVDAVYARIERDPRHTQVTRIIREPIPRRGFEDWTMGFCELSAPQLQGLDGVNDFLQRDSGPVRMDAGRARKLLSAFRAGRWRQQLQGQVLADA